MDLRIIWIALIGALLAPASATEGMINDRTMEPLNTITANMNQYIDTVFLGIADFLRDGGVVPFDMPDTDLSFSYKPLLIEYHGVIDLTNGILHDVSDVRRNGDCFMSYNRLLLRVDAGAALQAITFNYDYKTTVMGLGIFEGWVDGYAENIVIRCDFLVDLYDFYIYMQDFRVTSIGRIDVNLRGNILTDWLGNIMIDMITFFFKTTITEMVSERVKVFVQETLDTVNENLFTSSAQMRAALEATLAKHNIKLDDLPPLDMDAQKLRRELPIKV